MDDPETALARQRDREPRLGDRVHRGRDRRGMFSEIDGVSRVTVETSFGRTCDSAGRSEHVVEREPFLAELPLERDEALDLLLAELGLHGATLAASGDGDQATATPSCGEPLAELAPRRRRPPSRSRSASAVAPRSRGLVGFARQRASISAR